jgi:adenine-specific DNA-methyltransferase
VPLLSWHNRAEDLTRAARTPYRLLEPVAGLSHGNTDSPNMLIEGDNLDALKALLPYYAGQVKSVFIDPPYNTRSAFEHYDDNLEHSQWLSMMYPRVQLLRELLAEDGSLWVTLDDNEAHYFKVMCDDVFGRSNFVANITWQSKDTPGNNATGIAETHNHVLGYRKSGQFAPNLLDRDEKQRGYYTNLDSDARGDWLAAPLTRAEHRDRDYYALKNPAGRMIFPPKGSSWRRPPAKLKELIADNRIWWGRNGDAEFPSEKKFLAEAKEGVVNKTWWPYDFAGSTRQASAELKGIFGTKAFDTPKPEKLVQRILQMTSAKNDLVLDSFLGSGTTAAVAHKMDRRWIGIESGAHARTLCQPRLKKVVDGEQGGVSKSVAWQGGGGFRFYKLGVAVFDDNGSIREGIQFEQLAAHVWFAETGVARSTRALKQAFLGAHQEIGYYLLFNGILGDLNRSGGNVLTRHVLRSLPKFDGPKVIYAEACDLTYEQTRELDITFRQTPYEIRAR